MKCWHLSLRVHPWVAICLWGCGSAFVIEPGYAQNQGDLARNLAQKVAQKGDGDRLKKDKSGFYPTLILTPLSSTGGTPARKWLPLTRGGNRANPTDKGVEVILQTLKGEQLQITNRSAGNNFIADIPNAQLRLPNGDEFTFRSEKPLAGITEITVTNFDANTIRVTVIGEASLPTVELFDSDEGLIFGLTSATSSAQQPPQKPEEEQPANQTQPTQPSASGDEPIELVVTGEQDGYRVTDGSTATKTDTPLRDIPQSIQVVPQEVLRDQQVTGLEDALRNVAGVTPLTAPDTISSTFNIRGFGDRFSGNYLTNGLSDPNGATSVDLTNIERIEVLKGPASVLFGSGLPGGTINLITKQPLSEPFYAVNATVGSYDFYRGAIDLSGPLNDSKTVLYRLNTSYRDSNSFINFRDTKLFLASPVVSWAISKNTQFTLEGKFVDAQYQPYLGIPAVGTVLSNPNGQISRSFNLGEPTDFYEANLENVGYTLEHRFSDNWSLKNAFRVSFSKVDQRVSYGTSLAADNRTLNRRQLSSQNSSEGYNLATDLVGKFFTGSIEHQLLFGFDLSRSDSRNLNGRTINIAPIDLFNPVYGQPGSSLVNNYGDSGSGNGLGIYVQDQVKLAENLKLLLGVRFDAFEQESTDLIEGTKDSQSGNAFSPRFGIVYQPIPAISLYASYARSFNPLTDRAFDGSLFQPERGTQYEVGVKADFNQSISTTLAFFDLTRSNVLTEDLVNPGYSIQTGKQRSQGIELSLTGKILPGWNIIGGYAYTDARIEEDNTYKPGNQLSNAPEHAFNLWTTYEIQSGDLQGLGFGLGLFYVGERQGDLDNTFQLPSYIRTDAAIFYKQGQFRVGVNFKNLFNVDYFETAVSALRVSSGEPFTVQGTISWQF